MPFMNFQLNFFTVYSSVHSTGVLHCVHLVYFNKLCIEFCLGIIVFYVLYCLSDEVSDTTARDTPSLNPCSNSHGAGGAPSFRKLGNEETSRIIEIFVLTRYLRSKHCFIM